MSASKITRREALRGFGLVAAGGLLAACAPQVVEKTVTVKETVVVEGTPKTVEKVVEKVVEQTKVVEKVITAAPPPKAPVELKMILQPDVSKDYSNTIKKFEDANPGITVKSIDMAMDASGWSSWFDQLGVVLASGETPDTSRLPSQGLRLSVARKYIVPIDDFLKTDDKLQKEVIADINPRMVDTCKVKGKTYGVPWEFNNNLIWFNTKRLQEEKLDMPKEGWTWDDFVTVCQKLTKKDDKGNITNYGCNIIVNDPYWMDTWLRQNGLPGTMTGDDLEKPLVNDPKYIETVQFLLDLIYKYQVAPRMDADLTGAFEAGRVATQQAGRWPLIGLHQDGFTDYDVQYWPTHGTKVQNVGVGYWPIMAASVHKEEAWKFTSFLVNKDSLTDIQGAETYRVGIPTLRSLARAKNIISDPPPDKGKIWYDSVDRQDMDVMVVTSPPDFRELDDIMSRALTSIFAKESEIVPTLNQAQKDLEAMVARRPKYWG
jgi:multiple sugar transport system substrate-binding protein